MGLFKTYYHPITGVPLTNANCKFVSVIGGNDSSGDGTRNNPYATITKAKSMGATLILLSGMSNENGDVPYIIGDNRESGISGNISRGSAYSGNLIYGITYTGDIQGIYRYAFSGCIVLNSAFTGTPDLNQTDNSFFNTFKFYRFSSGVTNLTIRDFINAAISDGGQCIVGRSIITTSCDLYNFQSRSNTSYIPIFKNCLFRKATAWKWNGYTIGDKTISGTTVNISTCNTIADLIAFMYSYQSSTQYLANVTAGADRTYFATLFPNATTSPIFYVGTNGQSNIMVEDRPSVGGSIKIFNRYNGDTPVDYSLNLNSANVALTMSDVNSYVGCYKASADVFSWGTILNVNSDGSDDTVTTPDMLVSTGNGQFIVSGANSVQLRNRVRSQVFTFKRGFTLAGFGSQMKSGLASRFNFGKNQPYNITTSPTLPMESVEVIPYDSPTTPSAFPRFSAMFNDVCQMWYNNTTNNPILFSQLRDLLTTLLGNGTINLTNTAGSGNVTASSTVAAKIAVGDTLTINGQTVRVLTVGTTTFTTEPITSANTNSTAFTFGIYCDKNITEYGTWAVTNADYESFLLSSKTGISLKNIPVYYAMLELNLNYNV